MTTRAVLRLAAGLLVMTCALVPLAREASLMVYTGVMIWASPVAPLVTTKTGLKSAMVMGIVGVALALLTDRRGPRPSTYSLALGGIALAGLCGLVVPAFTR